ncbi:MAG: CHAD domain-containing protein [bacterium]
MHTCVNMNRPDSVGGTARRILNAQLRLMQSNAERAARDHSIKAIHDLRLAVRRFRAALWVFGELMPDILAKRLRRRLLVLNRRLGPIRDAQVWLDLVRWTMRKRKARLPPGFDLCVKSAEASCAVQLQALERILQSIPFREAQECSSQVSSDQPPGPFLAAKLLRAYKPLCRLKNKPLADLTAEKEHAFRRRCRRVRYLAEFTEPILGQPVQKLSRRLKRVANALGARHDAHVHARLLAEMTVPPDVLLLGVTCAKHEAQQEFVEAWGELTRPHFKKRVFKALQAAKRAGK